MDLLPKCRSAEESAKIDFSVSDAEALTLFDGRRDVVGGSTPMIK